MEGYQVLLGVELLYESEKDKFKLTFYHGWEVEQASNDFERSLPENKEEVHLVVRCLKD